MPSRLPIALVAALLLSVPAALGEERTVTGRVVDGTRSTIDGWGIRAFPTIVLIDPEGKLVKGGSERMLEEKLAALRGE